MTTHHKCLHVLFVYRRDVQQELSDVDGSRSHCDVVQQSRVQVWPGGRSRT